MKNIDPAFEFLMKYQHDNFFEKASASTTEYKFRCKGCGEIVEPQNKEQHFKDHQNHIGMIHEAARVAANMNKTSDNPTGSLRTDICTQCGGEFAQERKRGRPRKKCFVCLPEKVEKW